MKPTLALVLAAALVLPAAAAQDAQEPPSERYVVAFEEPTGFRFGDLYGGARVLDVLRGLRLAVVETDEPARLLERAREDQRVRYVEWDDPEFARIAFEPNDAFYAHAGHWGSKKIGAEAAWDRTLGSAAVKVAVIDSGLLRGHEEFAGQSRVLRGYDFFHDDADPADQGGACGYHGTHTAGTAGAAIHNARGIAGLSQHAVLPVKAFGLYGGGCSASLSALARALAYAAEEGAHVSSSSWGTSLPSATLNDAVRYAHGRGVIHVAAAGNAGPCSNCVAYPWRDVDEMTLIVSATTSGDRLASFSSEGPEVDIAAPGEGILSACGGYANSYCLKSGTSMATPHVAGAAALLKALQPAWTSAEVERALAGSAVDVGLSSSRQGAGRLDLAAATALAAGAPAPEPQPGPEPEPEPQPAVHVHGLDVWRYGSTPYFVVWAYDDAERAEAGVEVGVTVCKAGVTCVRGSAATGAEGWLAFRWTGAGPGAYEICVTALSKAGFAWDEAAGHASRGHCHAETV